MRTLEPSDLNKVSGGWNPWAVATAAIFIYDAVTDFAEGVQKGYDETATPPS